MRLRSAREPLFSRQMSISKAFHNVKETRAQVVTIHEKRYHVAADVKRRPGIFLVNRTNNSHQPRVRTIQAYSLYFQITTLSICIVCIIAKVSRQLQATGKALG